MRKDRKYTSDPTNKALTTLLDRVRADPRYNEGREWVLQWVAEQTSGANVARLRELGGWTQLVQNAIKELPYRFYVPIAESRLLGQFSVASALGIEIASLREEAQARSARSGLSGTSTRRKKLDLPGLEAKRNRAKARSVRLEMWEQTGDEQWSIISDDEMVRYLSPESLRDYSEEELVNTLVNESVSAEVVLQITRGYQ